MTSQLSIKILPAHWGLAIHLWPVEDGPLNKTLEHNGLIVMELRWALVTSISSRLFSTNAFT